VFLIAIAVALVLCWIADLLFTPVD